MLQNPGRMEKFIEMFQTMERVLIQNKFYILPIIYIKPEVDKGFAAKLREIVRRRNGQIVEIEENSTHILYPPCDPLEEEYARPGIRRDNMIMMHWYYFPESYDTWINIEGPMETLPMDAPSLRSTPWRVLSTWLIDSDQYNEWMAEEDYEVDELGHKKVHRLRLSVEDLMNPSSDPDRNRWDKCSVKSFVVIFCFFLLFNFLYILRNFLLTVW